MKDAKGKFAKGNQFYLNRKTHGQPASYTPEALLEKAHEYFEAVQSNPIELPRHKKDKEPIYKPRPMSIRGFCTFAGIIRNTFYGYAKNPDYKDITETIKESIEGYQLDHASIGAFKENIVARMIGLADKKENSVTVEGITGMTIK